MSNLHECEDCGDPFNTFVNPDHCPKCGHEHDRTTRSEPADMGGGTTTGVQDLRGGEE